MVLLVEYPSRGAFLEMIGSDEYQAIAHLRTEALVKGELHPLDPASTCPRAFTSSSCPRRSSTPRSR